MILPWLTITNGTALANLTNSITLWLTCLTVFTLNNLLHVTMNPTNGITMANLPYN